MGTRKELIEAVGARYRDSTVAQRSAILDEFVAITGYHRKHAIRLLSKPAVAPQARRTMPDGQQSLTPAAKADACAKLLHTNRGSRGAARARRAPPTDQVRRSDRRAAFRQLGQFFRDQSRPW